MRSYEAVYIFDSTLDDAAITGKLDRFHGLVAGNGDQEITTVEHWGRRKLAYPIDKHENGYYVVSHFNTDVETLPEFERALKLDEGLLRHLVVINEGELSAAPLLAPEVGAEDEEDEDEDEGEEEE